MYGRKKYKYKSVSFWVGCIMVHLFRLFMFISFILAPHSLGLPGISFIYEPLARI